MQDYFIKLKNLYDTLIESLEQNVKIIGEIENMYKTFKDKIKAVNIEFTPEYQCPDL
jgi:capsule polysaccharide export protein KpsE/RkpR